MRQNNYNMENNIIQELEVLNDIMADGRQRPWREHKMANELLSLAYDNINPDKAARLRECATFLSYKKTDKGLRLDRANFCRVRLCPICQWRRSLKVFGQTCKVINAYEEKAKHAYAMLTLTVKNCEVDELTDTISAMLKAWDRMSRTAQWKKVVLGWYRGTEITHNLEADTYHPHFHVLLAFRKSYFTSRYYLKHEQWRDMWRAAMRLDYDPVVSIEKCYGGNAAAIAEVTKYSTKPSDYIIPDDWDLTESAVAVLDKALDKRRFVAYGGEFSEIRKQLNLDDPESGDLIHVDDDAALAAEGKILTYFWYSGFRQYWGGKEK